MEIRGAWIFAEMVTTGPGGAGPPPRLPFPPASCPLALSPPSLLPGRLRLPCLPPLPSPLPPRLPPPPPSSCSSSPPAPPFLPGLPPHLPTSPPPRFPSPPPRPRPLVPSLSSSFSPCPCPYPSGRRRGGPLPLSGGLLPPPAPATAAKRGACPGGVGSHPLGCSNIVLLNFHPRPPGTITSYTRP